MNDDRIAEPSKMPGVGETRHRQNSDTERFSCSSQFISSA